MSDIEIEIDGKVLAAQPNAMVIQVADAAGIYIPRFCYHKHLSVAANCRMCLVEVEKSPKALPACATPVMPGMKVFTRSPKALAAQKAVMEFLLINHPLDCPICDQGGECELQDLSLGYGSADSFYTEGKRSVKDQDIGPLVETEMTRCIQCTRCVRFGDEIAGVRELGAVNRGEDMEISTYVEKSMRSEVSANIIDLCPVGALTSKPFRFTARAWELNQFPTIAPHDCLGSNIYAHTRRGTVMRVVPRENENINETWISDRDRFSYEALYHADRLTKPMVCVKGHWQEVDWVDALEFAALGLQRVLQSVGSDQLGALASPNATVEEFYLLQKLLRQLGSQHIDHRLRQTDFSDQDYMPAYPGMNLSVADIENFDVIVLVGSNIQKEQPMASLRVRKAVRKGARVIAVNMVDYAFNFVVHEKKIVAPHLLVSALASFAKEKLTAGKKMLVLLGAQAINHPEAAALRALAHEMAQNNQATVGYLTEGANAAGAWLAGMLPHRAPAQVKVELPGLNAQAMLEDPRQAYVLLNVEPDLDVANPQLMLDALEKAGFVVSLSMFSNPMLLQHADVILPIAPFTETSGTFVNVSGEWQTFKGVAAAFGESRPAWKVLRVLGNLLHCDGFDYESTDEIRDELKRVVEARRDKNPPSPPFFKGGNGVASHSAYTRISETPIYSTDSLVRRATALQKTQPVVAGDVNVVRMNAETARALQVKEQEWVTVKQKNESIRLPVSIDDCIPDHAVWIASGIEATKHLSELFGVVELAKE